MVITDSYDKDIHVQSGYKGNIQYLITKKPDDPIHSYYRTGESVFGLFTKVDRKTGSLYRMSLCWVVRTPIGQMRDGYATTRAFEFRSGAIARLYRSAIANFDAGCIEISDDTDFATNVRSNTRTEIVSTGSTLIGHVLPIPRLVSRPAHSRLPQA